MGGLNKMKKTLSVHLMLATFWLILVIAGALWAGVLQPSPNITEWINDFGKECGRLVLGLTVAIFIVWLLIFAKHLSEFKARIMDVMKIWEDLQPHPEKPGKKLWVEDAAKQWEEQAVVIFFHHRRLQHHIANSVKIGVGLTAFGLILVFPVVGRMFEQVGAVSQGEQIGLLFDSGLSTALLSTLMGITANIGMGHIKINVTGYFWDKFLRLDEEDKQP